MKDEGLHLSKEAAHKTVWLPPDTELPKPLGRFSFILHPSSFILQPSAFILLPPDSRVKSPASPLIPTLHPTAEFLGDTMRIQPTHEVGHGGELFFEEPEEDRVLESRTMLPVFP